MTYPSPQFARVLGGEGSGIAVLNNGQFVARSLVPGPGIQVQNPTGLQGDMMVQTPPGLTLLGSLLGANLNSTADQAIAIPEYPAYLITHILVTNPSATPTLAAGGFYSAASKAGFTLVAASQSYTSLTTAAAALLCTLASGNNNVLTGPNIYLSLTTANGSACTADVYVFGLWLPGPGL
jgi:hypothetical protein